jgi:peptidoglycan/xylan/chitin deacetylase (PgdA/CDA1 family)
MNFRIPVLTYHGIDVEGNDYDNNDHVALHEDLETIQAHGSTIVPLRWIAEIVTGDRPAPDSETWVALTFDDGSHFDWHDLDHPTNGRQRSFYNILKDFRHRHGDDAQPHLHATSFVIASPEARAQLDRSCLIGKGWWSDDWWPDAVQDGLLDIQNHSWDHCHPTLEHVCQKDQIKGSFEAIDTHTECRCEIKQAGAYIEQQTGKWPDLFAYPDGEYSEYLRDHYFPEHADEHRSFAAFGSLAGYVTEVASRWCIPRFVYRANWSSSNELLTILNGDWDYD